MHENLIYMKSCLQCNGDLHELEDQYGRYLSCFQCGRTHELKSINPPSALVSLDKTPNHIDSDEELDNESTSKGEVGDIIIVLAPKRHNGHHAQILRIVKRKYGRHHSRGYELLCNCGGNIGIQPPSSIRRRSPEFPTA